MPETLSHDVYAIPQEHLELCATIRQIARERIAPRAAEIDRTAEFPWDVVELSPRTASSACPSPTRYGGIGPAR